VWENPILGELSVRDSLQIRNYISDLEITKEDLIFVTIYYFNIEILKMAENNKILPFKTKGIISMERQMGVKGRHGLWDYTDADM
jgi:hypothetical protein